MRFLFLIIPLLLSLSAHAWNAAGHRLTAVIAWQSMQPTTRDFVSQALTRHPDHPRWQEKAGANDRMLIFAEAATWPDSIRNDPRFYDEQRQAQPPTIAGLFDHARHADWHYSNPPAQGKAARGELDRQITQLSERLRSTDDPEQITWALPWLTHLVSDLHQPLHTSPRKDRGGNAVEIEDPFNPRQPFVNLHAWWDQLPGKSSLRGKRLHQEAAQLIAAHPSPEPSPVDLWLADSRALVDACYPTTAGSVLPIVDPDFFKQSLATTRRQIALSGYRLAGLLDAIHAERGVPHETGRR